MSKYNKEIGLPDEVHFSYDICHVLIDMNSHLQPEYRSLFKRYPCADGMRDISICMSARPTDAKTLIESVKKGEFTWIGIGWLPFITAFTNAASRLGMSAVEYADWLYDECEKINDEIGSRAAWIEAYGEIGNSITWPKGSTYTKKEALEYFRQWLKDGRSLTEHWMSISPPEVITYYTHAKKRNEDFRKLPIYYSEGTLFSIHEAFRNGFPLVVYEGQCGTMNPIQAGIAFVRGGAKMYNAYWGCDFSPWTGGTQGEIAEIDLNGNWHEGMTPEYMFRTWITAYMSGCNTILHEVGYCFFYSTASDGTIIPSEYGHKAMQFYSLKKDILSERGKPVVPFALMLEEEHGYRGDMIREHTKEGELTSKNPDQDPDKRLLIWQDRVSNVTKGDWQIHRTISSIWPLSDNKWGRMANGWPDDKVAGSQGCLDEMRIGKEDAREYDRFLSDSRWADCFDVITECANIEILKEYYDVIFLTGDIKTDSGLWSRLLDFMLDGGNVVAGIEQLDDEGLKYLGIEIGKCSTMGIGSVSFENGSVKVDKQHNVYMVERIHDDTVIYAQEIESGIPLIYEVPVGKGKLFLLSFSYGMDSEAKSLSSVYLALIDDMYNDYVGVSYKGNNCQMLVNKRGEEVLVTLLNHTRDRWEGQIEITASRNINGYDARDVISDWVYPKELVLQKNGKVIIPAYIAPYSIRILSFGPMKKDIERKGLTTKIPFSEDDRENIEAMISKGSMEIIGKADR